MRPLQINQEFTHPQWQKNLRHFVLANVWRKRTSFAGTATFSNYLNSFTGIGLISFSTICFHIGELLVKKKTPIAAIKGNRFLNCFISTVAAVFARKG